MLHNGPMYVCHSIERHDDQNYDADISIISRFRDSLYDLSIARGNSIPISYGLIINISMAMAMINNLMAYSSPPASADDFVMFR